MPHYDQGDILLVDGVEGVGTVKKRLCAVAKDLGDKVTVIVFSTGPSRNAKEACIEFNSSHPDFKQSGLDRTSYLYITWWKRIDDKTKIIKKVGVMPRSPIDQLAQEVSNLFAP